MQERKVILDTNGVKNLLEIKTTVLAMGLSAQSLLSTVPLFEMTPCNKCSYIKSGKALWDYVSVWLIQWQDYCYQQQKNIFCLITPVANKILE